jgi:DNA-binding XRE family transcriptional regulator
MSQEKLAELAGVSRVYLGTIERGNTACSIDIAAEFCPCDQVLRVCPDRS